MTPEEEQYLVLAALETIRLYDYMPFSLRFFKAAGLDTSSQPIYSDYFKTGYLYIIQGICAIETPTGKPQIKIGIEIGGTKYIFTSGTVANAEDSVDYVGQLLVRENQRVFADFEGATANDTANLYINGYRVRFK